MSPLYLTCCLLRERWAAVIARMSTSENTLEFSFLHNKFMVLHIESTESNAEVRQET